MGSLALSGPCPLFTCSFATIIPQKCKQQEHITEQVAVAEAPVRDAFFCAAIPCKIFVNHFLG